jgi:mannose-1-phosphate guanylyltransferase
LPKLAAVILVGGPGTRLQPLTDERPKPMVPVLNRPFLEHTIAYLRQYGIEDIILTLSYLPDAIRGYFGDGGKFGVRLSYCMEEEPRGTAGAVKNAEAYCGSTFFVLNGDVFTDLNLADMLARHRARRAAATISLSWVDDPSAFGVVETDEDDRVRAFIEKPPREEATTQWINAGTYILEPEVLAHVPEGHYMFEKGLFPTLLEMGRPVYGYPFRGYWLDMGTPAKYLALNADLLAGRTRSPLLKDIPGDGIIRGAGSIIHPSAVLKAPVVVGEGCRIGQGARLENAILWDDVTVANGARLRSCIVSSRSRIAENETSDGLVITPHKRRPLTL